MLKRLKLAVLLFTVLFTLNAQAAENTKKHDIYCPVLTYHRLTNDISKTTDWTVTPEKFEKDIQGLLENGYTPIFTKDLVAKEKVVGQIPDKPVIIQFDDGYESVYELAYPILLKYNIKAEIYIITDYTSDMPTEHNGNMFLGWMQLRIMENSGLAYVGLHGKSHLPIVSGYTDEEIINDFKTAWNSIETNLGQRAHYYVYPSGQFNSHTISLINEAGGDEQFIWVWNLSKGIKDDVLPRVNVGYNTDVISALDTYKKLYTAKTR